METKGVPTYAKLALDFQEKRLYEGSKHILGVSYYLNLTQNWKRYVDNGLIIWQEDTNILRCCNLLLIYITVNIQVTIESSKNNLPFPYIMIIKKNEKDAHVHYKSTDSNNNSLHILSA